MTGDTRAAPSLRLHIVVGALQGIVLWLLYEGIQRWNGLVSYPRTMGALTTFCVVAPLTWYLAHGTFTSERARSLFACVTGLLFAALGAHAAAVSGTEKPALGSFETVLPAGVLGFIVIALTAAWEFPRRRFNYARLFEVAWRNAALAVLAVGLTAGLWVVLAAGAWLMESIGLHGVRNLYGQPVFTIPVTATVLGLSFALALGRANLLIASQAAALSLAMWFLPLALLFAVAWVAALPFTGIQPLFNTGNAAFYLLWFGTLGIVFLNAAFQDGSQPPAYPRWLASAFAWAWLALPVLAVLAGWALWQRIAQHGWTPERIWAAVVWATVTVCALGYGLSLPGRGTWMHTVAPTNIAAAILLAIVIVALISPIADVHRIAVASQVARLRTGAVPVEKFDWDLLLRKTGRYGIEALEALARSGTTDEQSKILATRAADALRTAGSRAQDSASTVEILRERIAVRPPGTTVATSLLERLARPLAELPERSCVARPDTCALWLIDLDRDGNAEAVLLADQKGGGTVGAVYSQSSGGWRKEGLLHDRSRSVSVWLTEIDAGRVSLASPKWPDLSVSGERVRIAP